MRRAARPCLASPSGQNCSERFLHVREQQQLIGMAHFRRTQQCQGEVANLTFLITLCCYPVRRDDTGKRTDSIERNKNMSERFKSTTLCNLCIIAHNTT
jgi:hypothetical protein